MTTMDCCETRMSTDADNERQRELRGVTSCARWWQRVARTCSGVTVTRPSSVTSLRHNRLPSAWRRVTRDVSAWILYAMCACVLLGPLAGRLGADATAMCNDAQSKCVRGRGCRYALGNYMDACGEVIDGKTTYCSDQCQEALISLLTTEEEQGAFMTCNCSGDTYCMTQKTRIRACTDTVLPMLRNVYNSTTPVSCRLANMICAADTACYTALSYYERHCGRMFSGQKCTHRCNNSLSILYRQEKAMKLRNCYCDGTEEYDCPRIQMFTQKLCFGRPPGGSTPAPRPATTTHRHRHHHDDHTRGPHAQRPTPRPPSPSSPPSPPLPRPPEDAPCVDVEIRGTNFQRSAACPSTAPPRALTALTALLITLSQLVRAAL